MAAHQLRDTFAPVGDSARLCLVGLAQPDRSFGRALLADALVETEGGEPRQLEDGEEGRDDHRSAGDASAPRLEDAVELERV